MFCQFVPFLLSFILYQLYSALIQRLANLAIYFGQSACLAALLRDHMAHIFPLVEY